MKVSVIVPVYNSAQFLDYCLECLSNQTLEDIEIICVDNCSEDHSQDIILRWEAVDSRIRHIFNDKNLTQAGSMNIGLEAAQGEYVAECDSDDWTDETMYEKLYDMAVRHDCDVVQCGFVTAVRNQVRNMIPRERIFVGNPLKDMQDKDLLKFLMWQPHIQSAIYRKSFLTESGIRYRVGHNFEDTSLSFKIRTSARRYAIIPECLYYYYRDNPNSGSRTIQDPDAIIEQYDEIERWNEKHELGLNVQIRLMKRESYAWMVSRIQDSYTRSEFRCRAEKNIREQGPPC